MSLRLGFVCSALAVVLSCNEAPTNAEVARRLEGIQPGEERLLGEGVYMKVHRLQVQAPLGDGWHLATSSEGGFSVELPLPFNDVRMRAQATDGVEVRTHVIGAKTPGLLAWTASCFARQDGTLGPGSSTEEARDGLEVIGTPPRAQQRSVVFDDMRCVLVVEAQGAEALPPETERLRFLQSLRRTGKPTF